MQRHRVICVCLKQSWKNQSIKAATTIIAITIVKQRRVPASVRQQFLNRSSSLYTVGEYIREKLRNYELLRYRDNSRNSSNPSFKLKGPVQDKIIGLATK